MRLLIEMFMIRTDVQINADGLTLGSTHYFNYLMFVPHAEDFLKNSFYLEEMHK